MLRVVKKRRKMFVWVLFIVNIVKNYSNLMKYGVLNVLISWGRILFILIWILFICVISFFKIGLKFWYFLGL